MKDRSTPTSGIEGIVPVISSEGLSFVKISTESPLIHPDFVILREALAGNHEKGRGELVLGLSAGALALTIVLTALLNPDHEDTRGTVHDMKAPMPTSTSTLIPTDPHTHQH
ncbi:MAG TPA: hypothetical protein VNX65_05175 [Patescibacteria group bacterium]|jgi:hypothetical protein|nr:hypothetical protein [Patescibacteria group bacterium]